MQPRSQRQTNTYASPDGVSWSAYRLPSECRARGPLTPYRLWQARSPNQRATVSKPSNAPMRRAPDDDAVAWELAAAAHPHLSRIDADRIYIAIGVCDTFEAIDALLTALARDRIPLDHDVVATVASWLDCYCGQDAEVRLRHLLADVESNPPQRVPAFEERFGSALIAARDRRSS